MDNLEKIEPSEIIAAENCFTDGAFDRISRVAEMMASSKCTIPAHLQGSPSDCFAICMQAYQWQMNPYVVAQKTMIINGKLGYEAQLINAVVSASGAIVGVFHYEYRGDGMALECRVGAIPRGYDQIVWGEWLKFADVTIKNSPLWKTNPKQQLGYLQVKNWARLYAPATMLGVYSVDELESINQPRYVQPQRKVKSELDPKAELPPIEQSQQPPIDNQAQYITAPQQRRLHAIAGGNNMQPDDIKKVLREVCGTESTKEIRIDQYDAAITAIENWMPN